MTGGHRQVLTACPLVVATLQPSPANLPRRPPSSGSVAGLAPQSPDPRRDGRPERPSPHGRGSGREAAEHPMVVPIVQPNSLLAQTASELYARHYAIMRDGNVYCAQCDNAVWPCDIRHNAEIVVICAGKTPLAGHKIT